MVESISALRAKNAKNEKEKATKQVRTQMARLQRMYKIMQNEKLSEATKMKIKLAKQKAILDKLKDDRQSLLDDGQQCITEKDRKKERAFLVRLATYIQEKAYLEDEIKNSKKEMKDLDRKNMKTELELKQRLSKEKTKYGSGEESSKMLPMLENKLSNEMVELNKILESCTKYRQEIDELLRERYSFSSLVDMAMSRLAVGKNLMLDMIEQATLAFEKRDEVKARLAALEHRKKVETDSQARQLQELQHQLKIEIDKAIFYSIKTQKRIYGERDEYRLQKEGEKQQATEDEVYLNKLLIYRVKQFYGEETLENAVTKFKDGQIETMLLFDFVVYLFCEAQALNTKNSMLKHSIENEWKEQERYRSQQESELEQLRRTYEKSKDDLETWQNRLTYAQNFVEFAVARLNKIFVKAKCSTEPYKNLLGDIDSITVNNVALMLKEVERKMILLVGLLYKEERSKVKEALPLRRFILTVGRRASGITEGRAETLLKTPCPLCTEQERLIITRDTEDRVVPYDELAVDVKMRSHTQNMQNHLHSISQCRLPGSRRLMQQRFLLLGS